MNNHHVEIQIKKSDRVLAQGASSSDTWNHNEVPLFVTAYINIPNNVETIANYSFAILAQGSTQDYQVNYKTLKTLNPKMKQLAYLQVMDQVLPGVPGPGNAILSSLNADSTYCFVNGSKVVYDSGGGIFLALRDCRSSLWKTAFIQAADAILKAYPFDGLYFDNCLIFDICNPSSSIRADMRLGLIEAINEIRRLYPDKLLIGNAASYKLSTGIKQITALNGSLTEGRINDIPVEGSYRNYYPPVYNLFVDIVQAPNQNLIKSNSQLAFDNNMFYGVSVNYSSYIWNSALQDIKNRY